MKIPKFFLVASFIFLIIAGEQAFANSTESVSSKDKASVSNNFKSNFASAEKFWLLYEEGIKNQKIGDYPRAVDSLKTALKDYAKMKPEQSAAIKQIALSYEAMTNYREAIKYFELGAEITMSGTQKKYFIGRAQELRKKII